MELHYRMKELPDSEKPYERCLKYGVSVLSDAELLSVIMRTGSKNQNSLQLAQTVLQRGQQNLLNLHTLSIDELRQIPGIGKVKAIQLKCVAELSKRMVMTCYRRDLQINDPASIAGYYMEQFRHETREKLMLAMFDTKNHFLGDDIVSVGTVNSSLVSPREIFIKALKRQAVSIILLHNHPSGDPNPSGEDIRTTAKVKECGRMLGITLADHIIIGDNRYFSFLEQDILN